MGLGIFGTKKPNTGTLTPTVNNATFKNATSNNVTATKATSSNITVKSGQNSANYTLIT